MRLTYANVVSSLAVFLALGGVSYAAVTLPKNSVGAAQIKAGAVGSPEVADGKLSATDFGAIPTTKGARGDTGPAGAAGPVGNAGPKGGVGDSCAELRCSGSDVDGKVVLSIDGNTVADNLTGFMTTCDGSVCRVRVSGAPAATKPLRDWAEQTPPPKKSMSLTTYTFGGDPYLRFHMTNAFPLTVERFGSRYQVTLFVEFLQRVAL